MSLLIFSGTVLNIFPYSLPLRVTWKQCDIERRSYPRPEVHGKIGGVTGREFQDLVGRGWGCVTVEASLTVCFSGNKGSFLRFLLRMHEYPLPT